MRAALVAAAALLGACGPASSGSDDLSAAGGNLGALGGSSSGGSSSGGSAAGGAVGGSATSGGSPSSGGASGGALAAMGGRVASGGAMAGGSDTGGSGDSGGAANVGGASGGAMSGGAASGGAPAEYSPCPEAPEPCVILPLGDSITEGFASSGGGYRVELFKQAVAADQNITFVGSQQNGPTNVSGKTFPRNHEGRGGYTIDSDAGHSGISGSITQNALNQYHPDIVLLMIGTNDINGNVDVQNAPNRLGRLIDDITTRAPDALVVVASIAPVVNSGTNAKVMTYNAALPGLVDARKNQDKHVLFLDNYDTLASQPNWQNAVMADNLHPNDAGYTLLGKAFYDSIASVLH